MFFSARNASRPAGGREEEANQAFAFSKISDWGLTEESEDRAGYRPLIPLRIRQIDFEGEPIFIPSPLITRSLVYKGWLIRDED